MARILRPAQSRAAILEVSCWRSPSTSSWVGESHGLKVPVAQEAEKLMRVERSSNGRRGLRKSIDTASIPCTTPSQDADIACSDRVPAVYRPCTAIRHAALRVEGNTGEATALCAACLAGVIAWVYRGAKATPVTSYPSTKSHQRRIAGAWLSISPHNTFPEPRTFYLCDFSVSSGRSS